MNTTSEKPLSTQRTWKQFEKEVKALGYTLCWKQRPRCEDILEVTTMQPNPEGIAVGHALNESFITPYRNLTSSTKLVLSKAENILSDLKANLNRVAKLFPIARAISLFSGKDQPEITATHIRVENSSYEVCVNDDVEVEVLVSVSFKRATIEEAETEVAALRKMKEQYETNLRPFRK